VFFGRRNSMKGCRSAVPDTTVPHIMPYKVMMNDGKVVHSSPYFQKLEMEKSEEIEAVEIHGIDAMPFSLADRLSRYIIAATMAASVKSRTSIHHHRSFQDRHSFGDSLRVEDTESSLASGLSLGCSGWEEGLGLSCIPSSSSALSD
jgi:hypothetical protein